MSVQKLIGEAEKLLEKRKIPEAIEKLRAAAKSEPMNQLVASKLAAALAENGQRPQAAEVLTALANRLSDAGKAQVSIAIFKQAMDFAPNDIDLKIKYARECEGVGKVGDAQTYAQQIFQHFVRRKKYFDAANIIPMLVRLNGKDERLKHAWIEVMQLSQAEQKMIHLIVALCGPPGLVSQEFTVGGEPTAMSDSIYEGVKRLVGFFPRDPKIAYAVAWCGYRRGRTKDFVHYLRESLRREPDFCLSMLLYARYLAEEKKLNESYFVFRLLKERMATDKSVDEMLTLNRLVESFVQKNGWITFTEQTGDAMAPDEFVRAFSGASSSPEAGAAGASAPPLPGAAAAPGTPSEVSVGAGVPAPAEISLSSSAEGAAPAEIEISFGASSDGGDLEIQHHSAQRAKSPNAAPVVVTPSAPTSAPSAAPAPVVTFSPQPVAPAAPVSASAPAPVEPAPVVSEPVVNVPATSPSPSPPPASSATDFIPTVPLNPIDLFSGSKIAPPVAVEERAPPSPTPVAAEPAVVPPVIVSEPHAEPLMNVAIEGDKTELLLPMDLVGVLRDSGKQNLSVETQGIMEIAREDATMVAPMPLPADSESEAPSVSSGLSAAQAPSESAAPAPELSFGAGLMELAPEAVPESEAPTQFITALPKLPEGAPAASASSTDEASQDIPSKSLANILPPVDKNWEALKLDSKPTEIFSPIEMVQAQRLSERVSSGQGASAAPEPTPPAEAPAPEPLPAMPEADPEKTINPPVGFAPMPSLDPQEMPARTMEEVVDMGDDLLEGPTRMIVSTSNEASTQHLLRELRDELGSQKKKELDPSLLLKKAERYIAKRNYYLARKALRHAKLAGADEELVKERLRDIRKLELPNSLYNTASTDGKRESSHEILERLEAEFDIPAQPDQMEDAEIQSSIETQIEALFQDSDPRTLLDFGVGLHEMGLYKQAERLFARMVSDYPDFAFDAYYLAAVSKFSRKDYAGAASILKKLSIDSMKTEHEKIQIYYALGELFEKMSQPDRSKEFFKKVAELDANYRNIRHKLEE